MMTVPWWFNHCPGPGCHPTSSSITPQKFLREHSQVLFPGRCVVGGGWWVGVKKKMPARRSLALRSLGRACRPRRLRCRPSRRHTRGRRRAVRGRGARRADTARCGRRSERKHRQDPRNTHSARPCSAGSTASSARSDAAAVHMGAPGGSACAPAVVRARRGCGTSRPRRSSARRCF